MSDADFAAAVKSSAWRYTQTPPPAKAPVKKTALEMTDAEFAIAEKNKAWRNK
jgi:hypothetical protein